jgi:heme exporter protein A
VHLRGANGAGKTTLLRILAGTVPSRLRRRGAATPARLFLGHQGAVKGLLTARENLLWHPAGERYGTTGDIDAALATVGLRGYEDVSVAQLSAGQQRRVNLARLYLSTRPLWLLDEPFTAIDVQGVAALTRRIPEHAQAGGAVLLTSHQSVDAPVTVRHVDLTAATDA